MFSRDCMVYATDISLNERPKALNCIRVNIAAYVDLLGARNYTVLVAFLHPGLTAYVSLVHLNTSVLTKLLIGLSHKSLANFLSHSPSRFIGKSQLSLKLSSGYTAASAGHRYIA